MTILAIDSATGSCSAAVWKDGKVAAYVENIRPVMQSASLMPMVEQVLAQSDVTYRDLSAVAATVGPGSFTGIRVGLAAARGIAFAAQIEAMGFTTLDVVAHAALPYSKGGHILSILNAGKGEWYYRLYAGTQPLCEPLVGPLDAALALSPGALVAGNAPTATAPVTFPRADALAALAAAHPDQCQDMRPFYIRAPDAKLPVKKA